MQKIKRLITLVTILLISCSSSQIIYAKEVQVLNNNKTFIEYINDTTDEYGNEYISEVENVLVGEFVITAYCPCISCCGKSNGITASGVKAQANHTIAADTSILPFGTEVFINGESYVVEDRGGGVNGNHIDMYFNSHSEALTFGRRTEEVYMQKEVTTVLKPVQFMEYMSITGDLMKRKIAESYYDKKTGDVTWKTKRGEILATRKKNKDGGFENRVEENVYKDWERSR